VSCSCRRGRGRLRRGRSLRWRWRNRWTRRHNRWTYRWLGNDWGWRGRNLCGLRRWNDHRLRNCGRRRSRHRPGFDGARRRSGRADWFGNNRSGRRRNHGRRRRRSHHSGLHASRSGSCFFSCLIRYGLLFGLCFRIGDRAKVLAHLYCGFYFNRTGMRLFLGNSGFGQIVNDGLCLDLEFTSQFVDSDLIRIGHCPPGRLLFSVLV
jgi:hypothetical protein